MSEFKTYMSFRDLDSVSEVTSILNKFNIPFKIQDTSKDFDVTFTIDNPKNSYLIMLNQNDFEKASNLLEEKIKFNIDEIDQSHPLFLFSTKELEDVVKNYDEWHPTDVKLAKYLLEKENIIVNNDEIKETQLKKEKLEEQHEKSDFLTLVMGYGLCMTGGLAGIGIAIFILTGKKTLSNGTRKYIYSKSDRNHGIYMLVFGAICLTYFVLNYI